LLTTAAAAQQLQKEASRIKPIVDMVASIGCDYADRMDKQEAVVVGCLPAFFSLCGDMHGSVGKPADTPGRVALLNLTPLGRAQVELRAQQKHTQHSLGSELRHYKEQVGGPAREYPLWRCCSGLTERGGCRGHACGSDPAGAQHPK
jgi:hypothetical protein